MMKRIAFLFAACVTLSVVSDAAASGFTDTVVRAIDDGSLNFDFRYRYEFVDEAGFEQDAHANTLRSRLSFAPQFEGDWRFLLEFDDVRIIGSDRFNSTRNDRPARPAVPDPEGTDLNQLLVSYGGFDHARLSFGRQRIARGTQRYVGSRPWRQNEQTFDALAAAYGENSPFQAFYSYIFQINTPFGPEPGTPAAELDSRTHLLDLRYEAGEALNLTGYAYLIDVPDADVQSNATLGVRLDGSLIPAPGLNLAYAAEYGFQQDHAGNPVSYDADYSQLEGTLDWSALSFVAGLEVLGGNAQPGGGFRTPLATLHRIQGWSDRFVAGSTVGLDDGLRDLYLSVSVKALGGEFLLRYHDFSAERGGAAYGTEYDASATWSFADHYGVFLAWTTYDPDGFSVDVSKFWVQLTARF